MRNISLTKPYVKIIFFCMAFLSLEAYSQIPQTNNLISYYPFLGNLEDQSGGNHDTGVVNGDPSLTQNRFDTSNAAYYLDGTDDYLYFGNSIYADLPDPDLDDYYEDSYSISIWAKSSVVDNEKFIAFGESGDLYTGMISVIGDNIAFNSANWAFPTTSTSGKKYDNMWHQYTFVYSPGSFRKLFIDGSLVKRANDSRRRFKFKNYGLSVGVGRFDSTGTPEGLTTTYTGSVDDIRIWNVALSDTEVANLYTYENNAANDFSLPPMTPFVTTWQTDGSNNITIPLTGSGYDFDIDWGDGTIETKTGAPGNISHTYSAAGEKTVSITPNVITGFPKIYINYFGNRNNLKTVEQWGDVQWTTMDKAFYGASNLIITATDVPDLSLVTNFNFMFTNCTALSDPGGSMLNWVFTTDPAKSINMSHMFSSAFVFNQDISGWNMERVTNTSGMFNNARAFNQDVSDWDVSSVTLMPYMFWKTYIFNQPLTGWDVSNVTSMSGMFGNAKAFDQNINAWNVSKVTNMSSMFNNASAFNQPLNTWGTKTGNVTDMNNMFKQAPLFDQDINGWDVSSVTNMSSMFYSASAFNQDLSSWDVSGVTNMRFMFFRASNFNSPLNWGTDTSNVTNMSGMFKAAIVFNQDISNWDVSRVSNMGYMFRSKNAFNKNLSNWDVYSVTLMSEMFYQATGFNAPLNWGVKTASVENMGYMFYGATAFNQDINNWDVSSVTSMYNMFFQASSFNQDLNSWDVSSVTNLGQMFHQASAFNGDISSWQFTTDVTKNISMASIFRNASSFNQDISGWNIERVNAMQRMFQDTPFNQDISAWDVSNVSNLQFFLSGGKLSRANYDSLLLGWSTLDSGETQVPVNLNAYFGNSKYSNTPAVLNARDTELINTKGWTISDGGMDADVVLPEITSNSLTADDTTISITFSENVYGTDVASGVLETTDFLFSISAGNATLNATTPISISTSDDLTFVLGIDLNGIPDGSEILSVTPVLNSIFDSSGNAASTTQSNNTAQLNDLTVYNNLNKYGEYTTINSNHVNKNGAIGTGSGLDDNGKARN
jgi:surface protein